MRSDGKVHALNHPNPRFSPLMGDLVGEEEAKLELPAPKTERGAERTVPVRSPQFIAEAGIVSFFWWPAAGKTILHLGWVRV